MGFSIKKAVKSVTKPVKNLVKSSAKTIETAVSGTSKLLTGDYKGAIDKYGRTLTNVGNVLSAGTMDLTGRNQGIININSPKYTNAILGKMPSASYEEEGSSSGRIALRSGKGLLGGGSSYIKAKYPLGK